MKARGSSDPLAEGRGGGHPKYEKIKDLNAGAFGFVQLCREKDTGEKVAIKFMERGHKITKYVAREIMNHSHLLHPHIVQFKEVFLTKEYLAIAMEFAAGGDMFQYVKHRGGLEEVEARWFFQQLIIGMDYCHKMGVVNRDIKLENTLLDGSKRPLLKICDFGYSKNDKDSVPKSKVGTPGYTAPEVIANSRTYDGKLADVWSSGVMLYVMLFCEYPFERAEDAGDPHRFQKVLERILAVDYHFPSSIPVSEHCKDLLRHILVADPAKRFSIADIQRHPWYTKDLPVGVTRMNEECLKLKDHTAGYQTVQDIQRVVTEAIGGRAALRNEQLIDEVMEEDEYY
ncbi:hypothetical protein CVIRNUC_005271 [Coccomyxa viridis]|uniref:Protein kinase domain-containing protein n=1 Tax=Coccomyxa viridis TaxID=1274662 RepID=A0AAV1I4M9_9CHLO|nr:hypothetical protein CVIRNUC_005271 [Coccomyxa viridis]